MSWELPRSARAPLERLFQGRFEDRGFATEVYRDHLTEVQERVPPERLLVYEVSQGWGPLCAFLGVPVPDKPFPRLNDTKAFQRRNTAMTVVSWAVLAAPAVVAAVLASLARRRSSAVYQRKRSAGPDEGTVAGSRLLKGPNYGRA